MLSETYFAIVFGSLHGGAAAAPSAAPRPSPRSSAQAASAAAVIAGFPGDRVLAVGCLGCFAGGARADGFIGDAPGERFGNSNDSRSGD